MLFHVWKPADQHFPCTQNLLQASRSDLTGTVQRRITTFLDLLVLTWMFLVFHARAHCRLMCSFPSTSISLSSSQQCCWKPQPIPLQESLPSQVKDLVFILAKFRRFLLAHLPSLLHPSEQQLLSGPSTLVSPANLMSVHPISCFSSASCSVSWGAFFPFLTKPKTLR